MATLRAPCVAIAEGNSFRVALSRDVWHGARSDAIHRGADVSGTANFSAGSLSRNLRALRTGRWVLRVRSSCRDRALQKVRFGGTPKPTRETRVLPRIRAP